MLAIEDLLQPIDLTDTSGRNLRYDPLIDRIRNARSEEDSSLPMGEWEHQAKRADYPLVASLAESALQTRSKDLWLAVWLAEAYLQMERYDALVRVIELLLALQQDFWPSLYPEIEDGDLSLRVAPLQWALSRYSTLLQQFPFTADGVPYVSYKDTRSGATVAFGEEVLTAEQIDSSIAATPDSFYTGIEDRLTSTLTVLRELHLFCEEHYLDEGPSFVQIRSTLEELHHASSQISRNRRSVSSKPEITGSQWLLSPEHNAEPALDQLRVAAFHPEEQVALTSWASALQQLQQCADYMIEERPDNPTCYLLAIALQYGRDKTKEISPSSELRLELRRARDAGEPTIFLQKALHAMTQGGSHAWIDLLHYVWQAAVALNASSLQTSVLFQTRALLQQKAGMGEAAFEDDTPVASSETQRWLAEQIFPHANAPVTMGQPIAPVEPWLLENSDLGSQARLLAEEGNIAKAAHLLTEDASVLRSGRASFLGRLDVTRLCVQNGHVAIATHMLRQLLAEVDERKLEQWEDPAVLGELLSLFVEVLAHGSQADQGERNAIYARLCQVNPAMALSQAMTG